MTDKTVAIIAATLVTIVIAFQVVLFLIPKETLLPGDPPFYLLAVVGSLLAMGGMFYFFTRRTSTLSNLKQPWLDRHIIFGSLAIGLVFLHAAGNFTRSPALMLLAMVGLLATGVLGRLFITRSLSLRFAQDTHAFTPVSEESAASIKAIIEQKASLLPTLSADVPEGQFSLTLSQWLHHPRVALQYKKLSLEEDRLVQSQREVKGGLLLLFQRYWRPLHQVAALALFVGILAHLVVVSFFSDYVAHSVGREVYWWKIR